MNVLLIEPDKIVAEATQSALQAVKHKVVVCCRAQTALDALDEQVPDLIILEVQLGLHNGIEFLYEIRSYAEWQHIPVIVYTINTKAQDLTFSRAFADVNVQAVFYKPRTTTKQLVRAVTGYLNP